MEILNKKIRLAFAHKKNWCPLSLKQKTRFICTSRGKKIGGRIQSVELGSNQNWIGLLSLSLCNTQDVADSRVMTRGCNGPGDERPGETRLKGTRESVADSGGAGDFLRFWGDHGPGGVPWSGMSLPQNKSIETRLITSTPIGGGGWRTHRRLQRRRW
ncbi:hypothetical protein L6452_30898 [Arctium lappa]|uniref:Uncharacterized protein n=1 Tax=Arctium lappa TaxID=4217 RepID=A0ACB8ZJX6_ARCLA|nr:hypothetical protein L6452_30898 [Arctium lappa]